MTNDVVYSENEWHLIDRYGFRNIIENSGTSLYPGLLYPMMCCKAFLVNDQGPEAAALRRGMQALNKCKPFRLTPEFEELISVSDEI